MNKVATTGDLPLGVTYDKYFENGRSPRLAIAQTIRGNVSILPFKVPIIEMIIPAESNFPPIVPKTLVAKYAVVFSPKRWIKPTGKKRKIPIVTSVQITTETCLKKYA